MDEHGSMPGPLTGNMIKAVKYVAASSHLHPAVEQARRELTAALQGIPVSHWQQQLQPTERRERGRRRSGLHPHPVEAQSRSQSEALSPATSFRPHWSQEPTEARQSGERGREGSRRPPLGARSPAGRSRSPKAPEYRRQEFPLGEGMRRTDAASLNFRDGRVISRGRELLFTVRRAARCDSYCGAEPHFVYTGKQTEYGNSACPERTWVRS